MGFVVANRPVAGFESVDGNGSVYVADGGNARIQVFDSSLNVRAVYQGIGRPWAVCVTLGPHQYLYTSSNPDISDTTGAFGAEVYKMELDGTIVGRLGGKDVALGNFGTLHMIDCRLENQLIAGQLPYWAQTITLQP